MIKFKDPRHVGIYARVFAAGDLLAAAADECATDAMRSSLMTLAEKVGAWADSLGEAAIENGPEVT